jgi:hypothetical protein
LCFCPAFAKCAGRRRIRLEQGPLLRKSSKTWTGLVAQLVEQCPFNSKSPVLAIFSSFLFPFVIIAEQFISLIDFNV